MKDSKTYKFNGFEQIKAFFSWIANNPDKLKSSHISLYFYIFNQANIAMWRSFPCSHIEAMKAAGIGNKGTYYKCLDNLREWNLIEYKKGLNIYKYPLINLIYLSENGQLKEGYLSENEPDKSENGQLKEGYLSENGQLKGCKVSKNEHNEQNTLKNDFTPSYNNNNITKKNVTSDILPSPENFLNDSDLTKEINPAEILYDEITQFFPEDLRPKTQKQKSAWIDTLDKLMRIDGHSAEEIKKVIRKTRENDFWKSNFLSVLKLRKKNKEEIFYYTVFKNINSPEPERRIKKVNDLWK
ncbi:MAG: hypothetical protein NTW82_14055 [Bacteroidia bacterium]|nr:hypothetical protein [Bacteroidia bacterium]